MADTDMKEFLVSELSKRKLSTLETVRTLEQRYQAALKNEQNMNEENNGVNHNEVDKSVSTADSSSFWKTRTTQSFIAIPRDKPTRPFSEQRSTSSNSQERADTNISQTSTIDNFVFAEDNGPLLEKPKKLSKVYVGNIPFKIKEPEMHALCSRVFRAEIADIYLKNDGKKMKDMHLFTLSVKKMLCV